MKNIIEVTDESFKAEVLRANEPVVVDFYAPWCGPCKMLAPLVEQLAAEFQGQIKFAKVNVDNAPGLVVNYQITGVPTLALFRGGEPVDALVGLVSPKSLKSWLEAAASANPTAAITK